MFSLKMLTFYLKSLEGVIFLKNVDLKASCSSFYEYNASKIQCKFKKHNRCDGKRQKNIKNTEKDHFEREPHAKHPFVDRNTQHSTISKDLLMDDWDQLFTIKL